MYRNVSVKLWMTHLKYYVQTIKFLWCIYPVLWAIFYRIVVFLFFSFLIKKQETIKAWMIDTFTWFIFNYRSNFFVSNFHKTKFTKSDISIISRRSLIEILPMSASAVSSLNIGCIVQWPCCWCGPKLFHIQSR